MDDVNNLKKEIRRLQRRLDRIEKPDNEVAVSELVSPIEDGPESPGIVERTNLNFRRTE